jgi:diphosphoinositol-polyphosphate diphosphatase
MISSSPSLDQHAKQATSPTSSDLQQPQVQVDIDMSNMVGRIKAPPVCVDATLKKESMSTEELSKFVFTVVETTPLKTATASRQDSTGSSEPSVVSSGSSTASRESSYFSDLDSSTVIQHNHSSSLSMSSRKEDSERINLKVTTQKISRNGRQTQRWYTDPTTQRLYRMTTGCVPVVEGGKIMFVSSSRKPEWILPKGGWEMDEAMEESAIRETFEEAGVLGILGPRLNEIEYETRKAKKRRLEYEEIQRKAKQIRAAHSQQSPKATTAIPLQTDETKSPSANEELAQVDNEILNRIRGQSNNKTNASDGDTCSVASEASQGYTHVRMTLMPLYVTEIRNNWPEHGRFRKVVDIDEAIRMTESRPEFHAALKELKERNLHIPQEELHQQRKQQNNNEPFHSDSVEETR